MKCYRASRTPRNSGIVVDFGVRDDKGRRVGMVTADYRLDCLFAEASQIELWNGKEYFYPLDANGQCNCGHPVFEGTPGPEYEVSAIASRNGNRYGSASTYAYGKTLEDAYANLDAKIERARKAAVRKWSVKEAA